MSNLPFVLVMFAVLGLGSIALVKANEKLNENTAEIRKLREKLTEAKRVVHAARFECFTIMAANSKDRYIKTRGAGRSFEAFQAAYDTAETIADKLKLPQDEIAIQTAKIWHGPEH